MIHIFFILYSSEFSKIMKYIWERLASKNKKWRKILKVIKNKFVLIYK